MDYIQQLKNKPSIDDREARFNNNNVSGLCTAGAGGTILLSRSWAVSANTNCGSASFVYNGGSFTPASGKTFTFNVPMGTPAKQLCVISSSGNCAIHSPNNHERPEWWGGFGNNGTADISGAVSQALLSIPSGGTIDFLEGSNYYINGNLVATPNLIPSYVTYNIPLNTTLTGNAVMFSISNVVGGGGLPSTPVSLSTALQGTTALVVGSTIGAASGGRIVISGGTFTGSGTEEGPIEFNTIATVVDSTHLTLMTPLGYSYSAFGIAGASPRVFYMPANYVHDVRITGGGTLTVTNTFNSCYGSINFTENLEIDHITFQNYGNCVFTGGKNSHVKFHDNILQGSSTQSGSTLRQWFDISSTVYSQVYNNIVNFTASPGNIDDQSNNFICEETCHDNIFSNNIIGPVVSSAAGGIALVNSSFNNTVVNNRIWGLSADLTNNVGVLGIEIAAIPTFGGDQVIGNYLYNIGGQAILDTAFQSNVTGNTVYNDSVSTASVGLTVASNSSPGIYGNNIFYNTHTNASINSGGIPGTPSVTSCGSGLNCSLRNEQDVGFGLVVAVPMAGFAANTLITTVTLSRQYASGTACTASPTNAPTADLATPIIVSFSNTNQSVVTFTTSATALTNNNFLWNVTCTPHLTSLNQ